MKRKQKKLFPEPTLREKINSKLRRKELAMKDVLWLFAIRDGRQHAHYEQYYGKYDREIATNTFVRCTNDILHKVHGWDEAIRLVGMDEYMILHMRNHRGIKEPLSLTDWLWEAIKKYARFHTIHWFDKHAPKGWSKAVDKEREDYIRDNDGKWWCLRDNVWAIANDTMKPIFNAEEGDCFKVRGSNRCYGTTFIEVSSKYNLEDGFPSHTLDLYIKEEIK